MGQTLSFCPTDMAVDEDAKPTALSVGDSSGDLFVIIDEQAACTTQQEAKVREAGQGVADNDQKRQPAEKATDAAVMIWENAPVLEEVGQVPADTCITGVEVDEGEEEEKEGPEMKATAKSAERDSALEFAPVGEGDAVDGLLLLASSIDENETARSTAAAANTEDEVVEISDDAAVLPCREEPLPDLTDLGSQKTASTVSWDGSEATQDEQEASGWMKSSSPPPSKGRPQRRIQVSTDEAALVKDSSNGSSRNVRTILSPGVYRFKVAVLSPLSAMGKSFKKK